MKSGLSITAHFPSPSAKFMIPACLVWLVFSDAVIISMSSKRFRATDPEDLPLSTYAKRRRFVNRKMIVRRRPGISRMPAIAQIHKFHQAVDGSYNPNFNLRYVSQIVTAQSIGASFRLSDLPQSASFVALFDQYRITKVRVDFIPMSNSSVVSGPGGTAGSIQGINNAGLIATVIDYDDNAGIGFAAMQEYESFKVTPAISSRTHSVTLVPRIAMAAYGVGAFTSYAIGPRGQWVDVASPAIEHYGMKMYIDPYASALAGQTWQIMLYYDIEFRFVR